MDRMVAELEDVEGRSVESGIRRLNRRRRVQEEEEEGRRSRGGCRSRGCCYYCWTPWNGPGRNTAPGGGMFQGLAGPKDAGFKLHAADILIARSKTSPAVLQDIMEAILGSMRVLSTNKLRWVVVG